ncbi:FAD-dependent monooxygenase [Paraburkholderia sp.]|uniref:FAD-dependent monooxygenase n=1 Tax=Paraburkholderia sp. TaxID=1926495 RepID=UPI003D6E7BE6
MESIQTEVLVVGSGPTGAMLAWDLALLGVDVTIIDRLQSIPEYSREVGIPVRSIEILEQRGLYDAVAERSTNLLNDAHFGQLPVSLPYAGWQARRPYALGIAHLALVEVITANLAERFDITIRRGLTLISLSQDADGVTAVVDGPDGELSIRACYVVGCDGGQSAVRQLAGIDFPGTDGTIDAISAQVRVGRRADWVADEWQSVHQLFHQNKSTERFAVLIPQPGGHHRLGAVDFVNGPRSLDVPVTLEEINDLVSKSFNNEIEVDELLWAGRFNDATRQASEYRSGRVLLAGDAAHIAFAANGQGMNLGLLDATNLGWKLAAHLQGHAPTGLLDSYFTEQQPVAARALDNVQAQVHLMFPDPAKEPIRHVVTDMLAIPAVTRYMAGEVSGLAIRYPMAGAEHPLLGARMPDIELQVAGKPRWLSSLLHEGRAALVTVDRRHAIMAEAWLPRVTATVVPELPGVAADAVLVRPDGYVCWLTAAGTSTAVAEAGLLSALEQWFGSANRTKSDLVDASTRSDASAGRE